MTDIKRYNLVLPVTEFEALQTVADKHDSTVSTMIRRFIKLGVMVEDLGQTAKLVVREGDKERQIIVL